MAIAHTILAVPLLYLYFFTGEIVHTFSMDMFIWVNIILIIYWISAFVNVYLAIKRWRYIYIITFLSGVVLGILIYGLILVHIDISV